MKELQQIIQAYENTVSRNKKAAIATVVKVDGSAYRRPGARMLVTEDGELTGAISGGCLEGDALRKAQSVIFQQKSMLVTYDTTDEDDQKFGVGLGCNGIIQVLIEPILSDDPDNPIELLKKALADRTKAILVTVFSLKNARKEQIGTKLIYKNAIQNGKDAQIPENLKEAIRIESMGLLKEGSNLIKSYPEIDDLYVFYKVINAPLRLLLFGAGNDTISLAKMADLLGWEVWLIDGRKNLATIGRFPTVNNILVGPADEVIHSLKWDELTVALLMTHNFEYELVILSKLAAYPLPYIGILGPKKKTMKLLERLENMEIQVKTNNIYGPMGLDLGAEGSEEIALSVLAEIKTVLSKKSIMHLRDKTGPIHEELR